MTYEEIMKKVHTLRIAFVRKYSISPNTVYLGGKHCYTIKQSAKIYAPIPNIKPTLFGMIIEETVDDNHISVGLTIQED